MIGIINNADYQEHKVIFLGEIITSYRDGQLSKSSNDQSEK